MANGMNNLFLVFLWIARLNFVLLKLVDSSESTPMLQKVCEKQGAKIERKREHEMLKYCTSIFKTNTGTFAP